MKLMYITNDIEEALKAERVGIDIIFIDLEINGKLERQGHLDTLISNHTLDDIKKIKIAVKKSKILTRINPINIESEKEIDEAIKNGTDIIMLPMFKTPREVEKFIKLVDSRAEVWLLLETSEAFCRLDSILKINGIDRIHIGLNDLHLSLGLDFMFECLSCGIVDIIIEKIKKYPNIKYGFGGIAKLGEGDLSSENILQEHVRLDSTAVILSRSFKRENKNLEIEVKKLREYYNRIDKTNKKLL
ncbi:MAG: aldolase/citrate lyase family protein, partial [Clostridia bacterium]